LYIVKIYNKENVGKEMKMTSFSVVLCH